MACCGFVERIQLTDCFFEVIKRNKLADFEVNIYREIILQNSTAYFDFPDKFIHTF